MAFAAASYLMFGEKPLSCDETPLLLGGEFSSLFWALREWTGTFMWYTVFIDCDATSLNFESIFPKQINK